MSVPSAHWLIAASAVAALATFFDLRERRIPNPLTYSTMLFGVAAHCLLGGAAGLTEVALSVAFAAVVFLPVHWLGGVGGGDAKLALALAALLGQFEATAHVLLATTLCGALYALVLAARAGRLGASLRRLWSKEARATTPPLTFAYAPAFLLGCLVVLLRVMLLRDVLRSGG